MLISREIMRIFLVTCLVSMALLAVFFLRTRRMTLVSYIAWGMVAIFIPLLGPFLVILSRPGQSIAPLRKRKPLHKRLFAVLQR
jgi:hypothetical protein